MSILPPKKQTMLQEALAAVIQKVVYPAVGISDLDMTKIENNPELQRQEIEKCRSDIVYWIKNYFWTYDPRPADDSKREMLLDLFPKQVEMVQWIEGLIRDSENTVKDGLIEKARDSGVSCVCCAIAVYHWVFEKGFKCGFGSYTEKKVDQIGDSDSLFEKMRTAIRKLPAWMKPKGFKDRDHLLQCRIINPENGSLIIGEIGDNIGRGGRNRLYFVDESAYLEHPDLAESALTGNTPCRIDVSTPNGVGNWFYRKRVNLPPDQVYTYSWREDPRKTEAWRVALIEQKGELVFQREYNLNYSASLEGIAIPAEWVKAAINLPLPEIGDTVIGFDVAAEGDNENVLCPRTGPVVKKLVVWQGINTQQTAHKAGHEAEMLGAKRVCYDCVGAGEAVKGVWDTMVASQDIDDSLPFEPIPVVGGERASETRVWADGKTSYQKFINVRAEIWWLMRQRFEKTYQYTKFINGEPGGALHPLDELISIPHDNTLIVQLSTPLVNTTRSGKIQIEGKREMRSRGVKSPDRADALAYTFYDGETKRDFWFR